MDRLRKNRAVLRGTFTKAAGDFETLLLSEHPNDNKIFAAWEVIEQRYEKLLVANQQLYEALLDDASEEELQTELNGCLSYDTRYFEIKGLVQSRQANAHIAAESACVGDSVSQVSSAVRRRKYKLPTIEFKRFGGELKDWLPFWSQFSKIDADNEIDDCDKVHYLVQATIAESRARQLVDSFPATGQNYGKIVESLKTRFGREDLQIEVYVRELLRIILQNSVAKTNFDLMSLYDKLEAHIRALDTLGVTANKCAAMLFPLIESCIPCQLLRVWQRSFDFSLKSNSDAGDSAPMEQRLSSLMAFLKREVDNEQHLSLASDTFQNFHPKEQNMKSNRREIVPRTAADLVNCQHQRCIFCGGSHPTAECRKADSWTLQQKRRRLADRGACFRCCQVGHRIQICKLALKCELCGQEHCRAMCPPSSDSTTKAKPVGQSQTLSSQANNQVFLQTLLIRLRGVLSDRIVRALIDTGSQRSYVLGDVITTLECKLKRREKLVHSLFGGLNSAEQWHNVYDVNAVYDNSSYKFEVLEQATICNDILLNTDGPWKLELEELGVTLSDSSNSGRVELLLGADIAGKLYTGKIYVLHCGLVAMETIFGWSLMGKVPHSIESRVCSATMSVCSLLNKDATITHLWELDVLGITDPHEKKTEEQRALDALNFFKQTTTIDHDSRYVVRLPWVKGHPPLPSNFELAGKRLTSTIDKLRRNDLLEAYDEVFQEWERSSIIEQVMSDHDRVNAHYLPHRAVLKENSTTRIRPVFDASAREKSKPALNDCLEKGVNLIELIPVILLRFRKFRIGVVSDIRKAFLQIGVHENDRDFLRFLWINKDGTVKTYRHRRVVFGVNCSPFLLGATINHHLERSTNDIHLDETILRLRSSFYVDNCVTSLPDESSLHQFRKESTRILATAAFDLRGWESTRIDGREGVCIPVLGLMWDSGRDTLFLNRDNLSNVVNCANGVITKRTILSAAQRVFDPIGFTCPVSLKPKLLLQQLWKCCLKWDDPVDGDIEVLFRRWLEGLRYLVNIEIPRWVNIDIYGTKYSFHVFCDASSAAYAAVVFLRSVKDGNVAVRLIAAKARVAPVKQITIPRLELLAATIGARLFTLVRECFPGEQLEYYFWTDSSTVLSWIRREESWAVFVGNRVREIRTLTTVESWRHVPGVQNPADLASRGCSGKTFLDSRWWEGPRWLYDPPSLWPAEACEQDEVEINEERRKCLVMISVDCGSDYWHLLYFSKYMKTVRMIAWMNRFIFNTRNPRNKRGGELTTEETDISEIFVLKTIQSECFRDEKCKDLCPLHPFRDEHGLIRTKSRISNRDDLHDFLYPIILPKKHLLISRLVHDTHVRSCHAGTDILLSLLRETYWLIGGRRAVRSVISRCVVCKRFAMKPIRLEAPCLPIDRVCDVAPFEITGVDFAGPVYLRNGEKAWICLFTCAVYRAVHLELATSLSTLCFLKALRRFVSRRGRPKIVHSDNGTNFSGAANALSKLDWNRVLEYGTIERIIWKFNPPAAPWWGGYWERLVGLLKRLLRRTLLRSSLCYEDLQTVLCDCEASINARPLTYMPSDDAGFVTLTPAMFLGQRRSHGVFDCDLLGESVNPSLTDHQRELSETLRRRFRTEYLGRVRWPTDSNQRETANPIVGEVVLIGEDNKKRLDWSLGRIKEVIRGRDGVVRLVRLDTEKGTIVRPLQRVYPLECNHASEESANTPGSSNDGEEEIEDTDKQKSAVPQLSISRSGRTIKQPTKLRDFCTYMKTL